MANLTDALELRVLDYVARAITPPALTGPMRVQLLSALGTDDVGGVPIPGTEIFFGATAPTSPGGRSANENTLRWTGLPEPVTVAGYRILDSTLITPIVTIDNIPRLNSLGEPQVIVVAAGIYEVPAGGLVLTAA